MGGGSRQKSTKNGSTTKTKSQNGPKGGKGTACYCDGKRNPGILELYCATCEKWFHKECLIDLKPFYGLPFMVCYTFLCKNCSPTKIETWTAKQANFPHMCVTALANLAWQAMEKRENRKTFSLIREIIPFFVENWELLTSMPRRQKNTWHATLMRAMQKECEMFICEKPPTSSSTGQKQRKKVSSQELGDSSSDLNTPLTEDLMFGLTETDLSLIGPVYEPIKTLSARSRGVAVAQPSESAEGVPVAEPMKTRGAKRKAASQLKTDQDSDNDTVSSVAESEKEKIKKSRMNNDYALTRNFSGYPYLVEHPYNREGHRYYLVGPDEHAPYRKEFEDLMETKAIRIPAYQYRIISPTNVELSCFDRAPQLRLQDDHLTVTGDRGYAVVRCTHGVNRGQWYWEMTVVEQPENSHVRAGWSMALGVIQAPVGYDRFSYCWRSRKGTAFHDSRGHHYSNGGYKAGDVLGFQIDLGSETNLSLPDTKKEENLIKFKGHYYFEEKDDPKGELKRMKPLIGSKITCYLNGVAQGSAFTNISAGTYYPAISLYKNVTVRANFGPKFKNPLPKSWKVRPMSERAQGLMIEQCLSDILYFVEHEGKLSLDTKELEIKDE